jgi:uncharacterized protein (TIGR03066 family)
MSIARKDRTKKSRKEKRLVSASPPPGVPKDTPRRSRRWFTWLLVLACLVGGYLATCVLLEYVLWPRIPRALVGQWRVKDSKQTVTLEFARDGAFTARAEVAGKEGVVHARAQLDDANDKVLHIVSVNPQTKQEVTKSHIIHTLTEKELVMEDPTGAVSRFVRVE